MRKNDGHLEQLASMSLGDHLEELRLRLILILIGVFVGLVVGMIVGKPLVDILRIPFEHAVEKIYQKEQEDNQSFQKILVRFEVSEQNMDSIRSLEPGDSFWAYVELCDGDPGDPNTITPYQMPGSSGPMVKGLKTLKPAEGFMIYLKVSLVFGVILTSPWIFWQIWAFVSAGLYQHERRFVNIVTPACALLFIGGCLFFLLLGAPNVMYFFILFDKKLGAESNWTLQYYLDMVLMLTLVFGLAFQSPVAIVFAERMGLVTVKALVASRKYVFLGCFVVAAMVTPPDPVSQVTLAIPLYILYEGSIVVCRLWRRKREKKE